MIHASPLENKDVTVKLPFAARVSNDLKEHQNVLAPSVMTGSIPSPSADTSQSVELKRVVTCLPGSLDINYLDN